MLVYLDPVSNTQRSAFCFHGWETGLQDRCDHYIYIATTRYRTARLGDVSKNDRVQWISVSLFARTVLHFCDDRLTLCFYIWLGAQG